MASSPAPSPPDVSPPPKPTPTFTPNPAATSSSSLETSGPPLPPPSSFPAEQSARGRSKHERWSEDSDSGGSPSYRDVVISPSAPASLSAPTKASAAGSAAGAGGDVVAANPVARATPKIILCGQRRPAVPRGRADGWQVFESRSARRRRQCAACPPRRPVPADLLGRCFNCFSSAHAAAQCRQRTRCFRCKSLGHRSYECPRSARAARPPRRVAVWRRISVNPTPTDDSFPQRSSRAGRMSGVPMPDVNSSPQRFSPARRTSGVAEDAAKAQVPAPPPRCVSVWRRVSPILVAVDAPLPQRSLPAGRGRGAAGTAVVP